MGTPCAVTYANIVLFYLERSCLDLPLSYYKRYIDDLYCICNCDDLAHTIVRIFNSKVPSIQLVDVSVARKGIFLDLDSKLVTNDDGRDIVVLSLHQKPSNKYLYIPPFSAHNPSIFPNFIFNEMKRYRLACTLNSDFYQVIRAFKDRLSRRGYPRSVVDQHWRRLPSREALLQALLKPPGPEPPRKKCSPIITVQLPTLANKLPLRTIFSIPHDLMNCPEYKRIFGTNNVIIGHKNNSSLALHLSHKSSSKRKVSHISQFGRIVRLNSRNPLKRKHSRIIT
jgi:hypothetical protein